MISDKMKASLGGSSMIRKMFEEGNRLRAIYGAENVFDFSLGNPDTEPPKSVIDSMVRNAAVPGMHKYMSNAGWQEVRETVAAYMQKLSGVPFTAEHILMTVGAAGGLNVILRTILNPDDEVIIIAPYFVEYLSYIGNFGGKAVKVAADRRTFQPDCEAIRAAITPKTKAIILNTPHNPTGVIYTEEVLRQLAAVLAEREAAFGTEICVISDQPYDRIVYTDKPIPQLAAIFPHSIIVNSFSKSLSLPGARIGYLAVSPAIPEAEQLCAALTIANRSLGFVNAPGLFQKVIAENLETEPDVEAYRKRRDLLYDIITEAGLECIKPEGAFYLFPKTPTEDDKAFTDLCAKHNILVVPGSGFGMAGYVRLAYCVSEESIRNSRRAWLELGLR